MVMPCLCDGGVRGPEGSHHIAHRAMQNLKAAHQLRPRGATHAGVDLQVDVLLLSLLRIARAALHVSTIPLLRQVVKIDCKCCCLSGYRPQ